MHPRAFYVRGRGPGRAIRHVAWSAPHALHRALDEVVETMQ
jgi:hypothetical protein